MVILILTIVNIYGFNKLSRSSSLIKNKQRSINTNLYGARNRAWAKGDLSDKDIGTKLTIFGFDNQTGWELNLASSVAENFFGTSWRSPACLVNSIFQTPVTSCRLLQSRSAACCSR